MSKDFFEERKVKSNDIVNGIARKNIYDSKGLLLVKEGSRVSETHLKRMREEGAIQEEQEGKNQDSSSRLGINHVGQHSLHGKLGRLTSTFVRFQRKVVEAPDAALLDELDQIATGFLDIVETATFQVLGELYLSEVSKYNYVKPLYVTASLIELIHRYNELKGEQAINSDKRRQLIYAGLLFNIGLLKSAKAIYDNRDTLSPEEKNILRQNYPIESLAILEKIGLRDSLTIDAITNHNVSSAEPSFEAMLLRTPFVYSGISMPQARRLSSNILNPSREFAKMFAEKKLHPVLGGLFLKIHGLVPVGAILTFNSKEKGVVIKGPDAENIASSQVRMITNKSAVQLSKPGEKFYLHKTDLKQTGISDHRQFSWNKFAPFTLWER